jgi:JAB domain-containing protein similar to deubiquitination enzymes
VSLTAVSRFIVSDEIIAVTDVALREAGDEGFERFVLWTGVRTGEEFLVRTTHVPEQTAYKLDDGVCVRVDGEALFRLNRWQYEHGETLGVQVHSHPHEAYHSETDDTFPIVTAIGGVSIVVPEFARAGLTGDGVATYRLSADGWDELGEDDARALIVLGM